MPDGDLVVDLAELAIEFALPPLELVEFRPGASGVWRLRAADGSEVALSCRPAPAASNLSAYRTAELRTAGDLERAAAGAGIDMVAFLEPRHAVFGLAGLVGDHLAVLHRWVTVTGASETVAEDWLGQTVAVLHQLFPDLPADPAELRRAYGIHPIADWRAWLAEAESGNLPWAEELRTAWPALLEAIRLSEAALALDLPRCTTHRDLNPPNLLHAADGPLLCDFGYAGLDVAWLEAVDAALSCTRRPGEMLEHYERSGGAIGPRSLVALARLTSPMWLAYCMWVSLGHREVSPERRAGATKAVTEVLGRLVADIESLDATAALVFG